MICDPFEVVEVPYPFSDPVQITRRKALVISSVESNAKNRCTTLIVLTSMAVREPWPRDVVIEEWSRAGLRKPCIARMKLFTVANIFLLERIGALCEDDRKRGAMAIRKTLGI